MLLPPLDGRAEFDFLGWGEQGDAPDAVKPPGLVGAGWHRIECDDLPPS
jgi:hypothetical protein